MICVPFNARNYPYLSNVRTNNPREHCERQMERTPRHLLEDTKHTILLFK